jgi:putative transcription antitermination factor YqgF
MKNLGLDIGAVWVGSALSDDLGITCRPFKTVRFEELISFLKNLLSQEPIGIVVVGHPVTVGGKISAQTKETEVVFERLKGEFSEVNGRHIEWILRDERFSSQRALSVMKGRKGGDKENKEHSIAAAFILQSYLDSREFALE